MVRQVEHLLRQASGLHDAAHLDRALFLDQLTDNAEEVRRELFRRKVKKSVKRPYLSTIMGIV